MLLFLYWYCFFSSKFHHFYIIQTKTKKMFIFLKKLIILTIQAYMYWLCMVRKWLKNFRCKCICIYSLLDLCFLPLQIFKYVYTRKMCVFLFIWFFFMVINFQNRYTGEWVFIVINFQKWVYRGMNVLFLLEA